MRLECYQSGELQAKIAEYEAAVGHPFPTFGFEDEPLEKVIELVDMTISYGVNACKTKDDDEIRWRNKCDEYYAHFHRGIAGPIMRHKPREKWYEILSDCIERGEPYDPYANIDGDPSDVMF